jgi:hypothetical protein
LEKNKHDSTQKEEFPPNSSGIKYGQSEEKGVDTQALQ